MRKIVLFVLATISCFTTFSQEAESENTTPDFVVIPRFDANPYIATKHTGLKSFDFGATSLYTLFEGSVGNFSYSMSNHWLSTSPADLYRNTFRSDDVNWLDWLTLTYNVGQFGFTVGKDVLAVGGYEIIPSDVDQHQALCSTFWHNAAVYQWGAKVDYTSKDESTYLAFQFATSPFGEHPFSSKLFTYSLYWSGEYGCWAPAWSLNFIEHDHGKFHSIISLGNRFSFGDFSFDVDYTNFASSFNRFFEQSMALTLRAEYKFGDKVELFAKGGYEHARGGNPYEWVDEDTGEICYDNTIVPSMILPDKDYFYYGAGVHYYPLRDSQDLRLHAIIASNNYAKGVSMTFGATYYFNLTKTILKHRKR